MTMISSFVSRTVVGKMALAALLVVGLVVTGPLTHPLKAHAALLVTINIANLSMRPNGLQEMTDYDETFDFSGGTPGSLALVVSQGAGTTQMGGVTVSTGSDTRTGNVTLDGSGSAKLTLHHHFMAPPNQPAGTPNAVEDTVTITNPMSMLLFAGTDRASGLSQ